MSSSEDTTSTESTTKYLEGSVQCTKTIPTKDNVKIQAQWIIPDFMKLYKNNKEIKDFLRFNNEQIKHIYSPPTVLTFRDCEWKVQLGIGSTKSKDNIGIYFRLSPAQVTTVFIKSVELKMFTFDKSNWVYDQERSIIDTKEHLINKANDWIYFNELLIVDSFIERDDKICYMKNGGLHLKFEFDVICEPKKCQWPILTTQLNNAIMEGLFRDSTYADVMMKSADGEEFRVHKAVLANRCAVLKAHFEHNTAESVTNIVESHLESAILHELLLFIYTDNAPKVDEIPEKLLAAADFYQLSRLKSICEEALHKKLTVDNAIEILQLADLHSAETLKQLTLEFIRRDDKQQRSITKSEGWANLQSVHLLKMICEYSR